MTDLTKTYIEKIKKETDDIETAPYAITYLGNEKRDSGILAVFYMRGGIVQRSVDNKGNIKKSLWNDKEILIPIDKLSELLKSVNVFDAKNTWLGRIISEFEDKKYKVKIIHTEYENKHVISGVSTLLNIEDSSSIDDDSYLKIADISKRYPCVKDINSDTPDCVVIEVSE